MQSRHIYDALKLLERFMKEYGMSLDKACDAVSSYTALSVDYLKKAYHEKHEVKE